MTSAGDENTGSAGRSSPSWAPRSGSGCTTRGSWSVQRQYSSKRFNSTFAGHNHGVRTTPGEQTAGHHAGNAGNGIFHLDRINQVQIVHINNHIAVVGHKTLAHLPPAAHAHPLARPPVSL